MSAPTVTAEFGNPSPETTVANLQELVTQLNLLALPQDVGDGSYLPYIISANTPAVEDQDKLWYRLDNADRPIGTYSFYNGNWRIQYTGRLGEIRFFSGDPTLYFDATGLGIVGGIWDGFALANGQNNTPDLSNTFIATANMNNSGGGTQYDNGWQSYVNAAGVVKTGGAASLLLADTQLPNIRVTIEGKKAYDDGETSTDYEMIVTKHGVGGNASLTVGNFGSNPNPDDETTPIPQVAMPTIPPFYALAAAQFVGY